MADRDIELLESDIERLAEMAVRCRKIMLAAQAAIVLGALLLVAILFGFVRADATPLFGSLAAIIGGIVVFGSNASTARQLAEQIAEAEAERAELIAGLDLQLVSDSSAAAGPILLPNEAPRPPLH